MHETIDTTIEKIYILQPITRENADKYKVLQEEAVSLIESAGALYCGTTYQNIREINAATFFGSGKLLEIRELLSGLEDVTVLFNGELSPSQTLNISAALDDRKVIDRTTLILDIFAKNAQSSEGKLQVELAQLKYLYPRLKGKGGALSRLGGGVGTRGPGETQLETDRRYIRGRLNYLEKRLKEMEKRRALQTIRRKKTDVKTIALVGYTNTGKSTLMNLLTESNVYVQNELFATLDPTARSFQIEGVEFLLVDTVGFLQELPHNLIDAFKSTLESALNCDLALIVCDATGEYDMQLKTTLQTLEDMGFDSPYLVVMNKSENILEQSAFPYGSIAISAMENLGIDGLKRSILEQFREELIFCELFVPYASVHQYNALKNLLTERSVIYTDDGATVNAIIPARYAEKFTEFIVQKLDF
ncbi:MAG: GTPase HflX [Clostridia bacterium]|nr:GTPase HflX [Clostridia bacterium]